MSLKTVRHGLKIAGVDEVGRGPLAGPVVAAAVILNDDHPIEELKDSKKLTEKKRETLYTLITEQCLCYAIGSVSHTEIDRLNIHNASLLAMQRAVNALKKIPDQVLVDGKFPPELPMPTTAIIKGDQTVPVISAASIIAKVTRDRELVEYDKQYPGYGFAQHKGYPTAAHIEAIQRLGITPIHRLSYGPVKKLLIPV